MRQLILHHKYGMGVAWDVSDHQNHGVVHDVSLDAGAMHFGQPSSRIDVPPSPTLSDLRSFRACATFQLQGTTTSVERFNLVENQLSFALYIDQGYKLTATILDGNGAWSGVSGPSHPLGLPFTDGRWHRADCGHDGLSTIWLALDGKVIATRSDVPGPVRPVGPAGLTIGHWPEPVDRYAFRGDIGEVWLWRDRPDPPFDDCCLDRDALADAGSALRRLGYDRDALLGLERELHGVVAALHTQLPDTARAGVAQTAPKLLNAFRRGRYAQFAQHARHLRLVLEAGVGPAAVDQSLAQVSALLAPIHDDKQLRGSLLGLMCGERPRPWPPRRPSREPWPDREPREPYASDPAAGEPPGYPPAEKPADTRRPPKVDPA